MPHVQMLLKADIDNNLGYHKNTGNHPRYGISKCKLGPVKMQIFSLGPASEAM